MARMRITVADLRTTAARTEELLRKAGELGADEHLYLDQETGSHWQVFVKRSHMAGPVVPHPVIGWFGMSGWLGVSKKDALRDLIRTNAALIMHLKRTGKM